MYKLNLPEFSFRLRKAEGKVWIFDGIRKKYIVLTPEEWVRQHFIHYLVTVKKYPKSLIRVEGGLAYNELRKRTDIVVFGRDGQPWMIIECKAPTLAVSTTTLEQASVYNSTLQAPYLCITNGLTHFCAHVDWKERATTLLQEFPEYG